MSRSMKRHGVIGTALAVLVAACAGGMSGQLDLGADAYRAGDLDGAQAQWEPLAVKGDLSAEFGMGLIAESRAAKNPSQMDVALDWYLKAAKRGHTDAQYRAGLIQLDMGEAPACHHWFKLAAACGHKQATRYLIDNDIGLNSKFRCHNAYLKPVSMRKWEFKEPIEVGP